MHLELASLSRVLRVVAAVVVTFVFILLLVPAPRDVTGMDVRSDVSDPQVDSSQVTETVPSSTVEVPAPGQWYSLLEIISGTANSGDGVDAPAVGRVEVSIYDNLEKRYWTGDGWRSNIAWLGTELTQNGEAWSWSKASELPTWQSCGSYAVTCRAIAGKDEETPGAGSTFSFDSEEPDSEVMVPVDGQPYCSLPMLSGTASDGAGCAGVATVMISIRRDADNEYWNGSGWGGTEILLATKLHGDPPATWSKSEGLPEWEADKVYTIRSQASDLAGNTETLGQGRSFHFTKCLAYLPTTMKLYPSWIRGRHTNGKLTYSLAVCPRDPKTVYAGTSQDGVSRSDDGGKSWPQTNLSKETVRDIAVHPQKCQEAFATTWGAGILWTGNGGGTWASRSNGLNDPYVYSVVIDPASPSTLYAGTASRGVYKTINGGGQWKQTGLAQGLVAALAVDPDDSKILFAAVWGDGIHQSTDGGEKWSKLAGYSGDPHVYALAIDPTATGILYAATSSQGIYRGENGGATWTQEGLAGKVAYTVAVDKNGIAFAGSDGAADGAGVHERSGDEWSPVKPQLGRGLKVRSLAFSESLLLAATTDGVWWYGTE